MKRASHVVLAAVAFGAAALIARPADAQTALGSGNALDANPSITGGRSNSPLPLQDYRARNLIITGNVAGGRGFQGSVGYRADGDFTGTLGSDDLYDFRARTALSGLDYVTFGRNYDRLMLGQDLGVIEYRRSAFSPTGNTLNEFTGQRPAHIVPRTLNPVGVGPTGPIVDAEVRLDRIMSDISSAALLSEEAEALPVGIVTDPHGNPYLAQSSSLRGLRFENPGMNVQQIGLGTFDMARALEEIRAGTDVHLGKRFETSFESLSVAKPDTLVDTKVPAPNQSGAELAGGSESYKEILKKVAERYADRDDVHLEIDPALLKGLDKEYDALRRQLALGTIVAPKPQAEFSPDDPLGLGLPGGMPAESPDTGSAPSWPPKITPGHPTPPSGLNDAGLPSGISTPSGPGSLPVLPKVPGASSTDTPGASLPESDPRNTRGTMPSGVDLRMLSEALRHGQEIQQFAGNDPTRFNELLASAENAMRKGDYFFAEARFMQALRYTPNHPLTTAGVGHAQLGAGLYASASLTLRSLMTHNPEMIDTRYDARLLPAPARLDAATAALRTRAADQRSRAADRASAAFLLAYIGHQRQDAGLMRDGLNLMSELAPDDPLTQLLRNVWLGGAKSATEQGAAAGTPAVAEPGK